MGKVCYIEYAESWWREDIVGEHAHGRGHHPQRHGAGTPPSSSGHLREILLFCWCLVKSMENKYSHVYCDIVGKICAACCIEDLKLAWSDGYVDDSNSGLSLKRFCFWLKTKYVFIFFS